jgi:hypothetical protein
MQRNPYPEPPPSTMPSTTTQTQTQSAEAQMPNITIITRVISIPMVSSGLDTLNDALTTNAYTRFPYVHAKALSNTAYKLTGPIQNVLAPIIVRVDGIANMAVDVVESRYPYPFKAKPEEVAALARQGQENMNKAIDEKVRTPALNVAQDIDHVSLFLSFHVQKNSHNFFKSVFLPSLIISRSPFVVSMAPNQSRRPLPTPNINTSVPLHFRRLLAITSMSIQTTN